MARTSTDPQARGTTPVSVVMAATVVWNLYGFATNFFERTWGNATIPVTPISYLLNAAIAACVPFTREGKRGMSATAALLGVLMALWSAGGLCLTPRTARLAPALPGRVATAVPALLGSLTAILAVRECGRTSRAR